ncbi:MAG: aminodeoxychorismate synthase component I [Planctomycetales bacterium]|nr:aminodeoxychorismate synthase component I [Planctomycetales bacterium]
MSLPWVRRIEMPDPEVALPRLAALPYPLLLDSAMQHPTLGRYSFLAADPFEVLVDKPVGPPSQATLVRPGGPEHADPLAAVEDRLIRFPAATVPGLPPFQGGAAGLLGYELGQCFEKIPNAAYDEFACPRLMIGLYDVVIAMDHLCDEAWIISQGFPELDPLARSERAERRGLEVLRILEAGAGSRRAVDLPRPLRSDELAAQFSVADVDGLTSDFSERQYLELVRRAVEYIYAGDIFQVNLSQRFLHPAGEDSLSLYFRLRRRNPATFAGYFDIGAFQILSASPERFVQARDGLIETRPIKGTRRRIARPEADLYAAADLSSSAKDRSENVMIVDLLRNDLSRVCVPDSVRVTQLCQLEQYEFVQHLVSAVEGRLDEGVSVIDLLRAAFPGGSITGAPKVRAMEIIAELEPTARGPYCGSLGYLGFDGAMDFNILIRTITAGRGWWQLPAGGGIVAASEPAAEYRETLDKARGLIRSLRP